MYITYCCIITIITIKKTTCLEISITMSTILTAIHENIKFPKNKKNIYFNFVVKCYNYFKLQ